MSPFMQYLKNRNLQEGLFPNTGGQDVKPPTQMGHNRLPKWGHNRLPKWEHNRLPKWEHQ